MEPPKKLPKFAFKGVEGVGAVGGGGDDPEEEVEYEYEEVEEEA
jgi:hypothetical protein